MRLAYLYSRYPVISQTFCDLEMLELERRSFDLLVGSIHPPLTSLRHEHVDRLHSPIHYAPPQPILRLWENKAKECGRWPQALIDEHEQKYGGRFKAAVRARNASYFAEIFARHGIDHFHVHFANRAAHTALFLKEMTGIPFSITAHGQDFMSDLGEDDLLREICAAAEFVAVETDYSRDLLQQRCSESAKKIHRVYNGLDLENISAPTRERSSGPIVILSVGRLVPFKGFELLLEACAELDRRNFSFRCEIVGDGPLRGQLESTIVDLGLRNRVQLCGSLSQADVFSKLHECHIFALASIIDSQGASDVFPTVIMEAMACARPVVSTRLAGIPESVVDGVTGLLVRPGDWEELAEALDKLVRDPALRSQYGAAGRSRMESDFRIEKTIEPLMKLLERRISAAPANARVEVVASNVRQAAYLIDRWPDENIPFLEAELRALLRNGNVAFVSLVLHPPMDWELSSKNNDLVTDFEYLPDAMVIEAEWQSNRALIQELEASRANQMHRPPSNLFLEQARFALALRKLFLRRTITHVHATSSPVLLCALMLKQLLGVSISVAIEEKPMLSHALLTEALDQCVGGRTVDRELLAHRGSGFLFDVTLEKPSVNDIGRWLTKKAKIDWTGAGAFWQEWSERLITWTRGV